MSDDMSDPFGLRDYQAQMEAQQARAAMETEAAAHNLHSFIATLDRDGIEAMATCIRASSASKELAYLYLGILTARLNDVYGICPACGKNHDEALHEGLDV